MIVRPVRSSDLPALIDLARSTGTGLTTLPANEERLTHRVGWAEKTFRGEAGRGDADYLFVLENDEGRVVGISAIAGAVGLREPWYNFRVGLTVSASQELNIYREIPTLFLANDLTGNSELCSLFLHADYRNGLNGRMLAKARMLFIAEFPQLFGNKIIAEMRGVSNEAGRSPFWESLGRHFFKMEFSQADYLTGVGNKAFIAELMPKFPLYSCFLSEDARNVNLVVDLQLAGGVHEGFVTEAVERLRVTRRRDDGRAAGELAGLGVFEHKEVALFAVETDLGREGRFAGGDLVAQAFHIIRQGGDTNRAVRSQTLYLAQISHLRGAHHQHGVTP
jgi:arginine/ornithine succinyltransferase subunit-like protein